MEELPLREAFGRVLAEDLASLVDHPDTVALPDLVCCKEKRIHLRKCKQG